VSRFETESRSFHPWVVCLILIGLATPLGADDQLEFPTLDREPWWPFDSGPHYGEVAAEMRDHPRVVRLRAGSFDTRGTGWQIPGSLRLDPDASSEAGSAWLVQLEGPITEAKKKMLRDAGATIYRFHPVNTFLVRAETPGRLAKLPGVLWTDPYHPAYRIEPMLGQAPTVDPIKARNERISVRVRLFEPGEKERVIEELQALGAQIDWSSTRDEHDLPDRVYFTATPQTILTAARMKQVLWVEESNREAFPLNAESRVVVQSGRVSDGTPFWDAGIDGSTQIVGVMDTGLDVDTILMSHTPDDAGTPGPEHRKVQAYSAWGAGDMTTCSGTSGYTHGTNTAQCAVANRSDFGLDENLDGVARGARLVFQDIGAPNTCGGGIPDPMFGMYDEVRSNGGHLTNGSFVTCSYGTYGSSAFDLDQYAWDHREFLAFFSGGNGGGGNACPGTNKNNISSGGHYQDPFHNEFYGSYGPAPDGRVGPTILAPACDHANGNPPPFDYRTSASIQGDDNDIVGTPVGEEELSEGACGTSFSSPYLMGVGALIRDYFEQGVWPSGAIHPDDAFDPSGALVKAVLINSGEFVDSCLGCVFPGLMGSMGMGRTNLSSTLALAGDPRMPPGTRVVDFGMRAGLKTSDLYEEQLEIVDPAVPLKITVVWVDQPGSTLVNDLELFVVGPDATPEQTYQGNNFGDGAYSLSIAAGGATSDVTNVFEAVRVDPAELVAGTWRVLIQGRNVPMGDPLYDDTQPFALVASGGFDSLGISEVAPPGEVPLRAVSRSATEVHWEWEPLSDPTLEYSFYRGTMAAVRSGVYDHGMIDAAQCGIVGGTTIVLDAGDGQDSYYLVSGHKNGNDGSLGDDRPGADPQCP
jgi:hypothetical protein